MGSRSKASIGERRCTRGGRKSRDDLRADFRLGLNFMTCVEPSECRPVDTTMPDHPNWILLISSMVTLSGRRS